MIHAVVDDLNFLPSDAVVCPTTGRLDPTTPVVRRLSQLGGPAYAAQRRVHTELAVGAAVVTAGGGDLPAEFVIHAVIQSDQEPVTRRGVEVAWRSALQRAEEWEFARLTTPPLGTGAGNLSVEDAAEIMVSVLSERVGTAACPREVWLVVETAEEREVFAAALRRTGGAAA